MRTLVDEIEAALAERDKRIAELVAAGESLREALSDYCPGFTTYIDAWDSAVAELPPNQQPKEET
jgi:hypothetical protein